MSDRVLFFTLPSVQSLALSLVNLVTCLISIIFECFQYIFQVFSMRGSRERDQVYCFIVSGCFQWARMRAGYANRKRCIIVGRRIPTPSVWNPSALEIFLFIFFFDVRASVLHCLHRGSLRRFSTGYAAPVWWSGRSWNTRCRTVLDLMKGPY